MKQGLLLGTLSSVIKQVEKSGLQVRQKSGRNREGKKKEVDPIYFFFFYYDVVVSRVESRSKKAPGYV